MLEILKRSLRSLFRWRRGITKAEDISRQNLKQADTVIDFAASKAWPEYQAYIERKMARLLEESFALLNGDNDGVLRAKLAEAKALYTLLKDVDNSYFALKQEQERVNKPLMG